MKKVKAFAKLHQYPVALFLLCFALMSMSGYLAFRMPEQEPFGHPVKAGSVKSETPAIFSASEVHKKEEITIPRKEAGITISQPHKNLQPNKTRAVTNENELHIAVIALRAPGDDLLLGVPEGSSVYEAMKIANETQVVETLPSQHRKPRFQFAGKDFGAGLGFFVQEINGVKENPGQGMYWIYYVNGKKASAGVSSVFLKQGDIVQWKYEKSGE